MNTFETHIKNKFNKSMIDIAYSTIKFTPINTAEHFRTAAHLGFNALKGDIRPTKDGRLVMCHDAGFTFDENGRITKYDRENNTPIRNLTYDECMALEYSQNIEAVGHFPRVCDLETFISICKEDGVIAYVTIRDEYLDEAVQELMRVIRLYDMEDQCIVNSFTFESISRIRKESELIPVSQVLEGGEMLTRERVEKLAALKNSIVTLFDFPLEKFGMFEKTMKNLPEIQYAKQLGVSVHEAQVSSAEDRARLMDLGFSGVQITRAMFPYKRLDYQFKIEFSENSAKLTNYFFADTYSADVSFDGEIKIKNISRRGVAKFCDDGVPAFWLNTLPYSLSIKSENGRKCEISSRDGVIIISGFDASMPDVFEVCINI